MQKADSGLLAWDFVADRNESTKVVAGRMKAGQTFALIATRYRRAMEGFGENTVEQRQRRTGELEREKKMESAAVCSSSRDCFSSARNVLIVASSVAPYMFRYHLRM